MPRDGSNVYSAPPGTTAAANTTIASAPYNALVADLVADANAARPITAGGTGETSARLKDGTWRFQNTTDTTKLLAFDLSGQTTALTRTQKTPNYNGTLASQALGTAIASATTPDIGAASGSTVHITGTTTITGLGTADAGVERKLVFDGILTLTHNATSLILPGAASITTAAGDTAIMVSEGSGNWRCVSYQRAAAVPVMSQLWEHISTTTISAAADWRAIDLSPYRVLRIVGYVKPSTDSVGLVIRTSTNNGSSFDGSAAAYSWHRVYGVGTAAAADGSTGDTGINLGITVGVGSDTEEGTHFDLLVYNFNQALMARFLAHSFSLTNTGAPIVGTTGGIRLNTTARNAIAIFFSSGNIATGHVTLEGIRG